jgi:hypothetical protein
MSKPLHPAQQRIIDTINEQNAKYDNAQHWASVGPELLEALKKSRVVAEAYVNKMYLNTTAFAEAWDDILAPIDTAIAHAEAQQ